MFIGMFAAELLVKNAVKPLSFKHFKISGYGFLRSILNTMIGFVTNTVITYIQLIGKKFTIISKDA